MAGDLLTFTSGTEEDFVVAEQVSAHYVDWANQFSSHRERMAEVQEYLQATDTSVTSNDSNGWNNTTHIPKLTQIRDNLYANYQTGLFPNEQWMRWEHDGINPDDAQKRAVIEGYMANKTRFPAFREEVNQLLLDYIDDGNAYAYSEYTRLTRVDEVTGEEITVFEGPVPRRIDPNDIVYNPIASSWEETPTIVVSNMTEGDLLKWAERQNDMELLAKVHEVIERRNKVRSGALTSEQTKDMKKLELAGLGNMYSYLTGNLVEVLTFYGDMYDPIKRAITYNQKIIVADRTELLMRKDNPSWVGKPILHSVWRRRPGTLIGMSVMENLLGMQYRINHLENMKADALDLNVYPPFKIYGNVPEFEWGPNCQIHIPDPDAGDVKRESPDLSAMSLGIEINQIMDWMEEFAGAPKESMGFRTPGEKTAFEVNQLMTSAGRVFQEKITNFEVSLLEPLLNLMLSEARNNLVGKDLALIFNDVTQASKFVDVSATDLKTSGKLRPIGARHFSEQRQLIQNLVGIMNSPLGPKLLPHMSGKDIYVAVENALGIEKWRLFGENNGIAEMLEQQQFAREGQAINNSVAGTELGD